MYVPSLHRDRELSRFTSKPNDAYRPIKIPDEKENLGLRCYPSDCELYDPMSLKLELFIGVEPRPRDQGEESTGNPPCQARSPTCG